MYRELTGRLVAALGEMGDEERIDALNEVRAALHAVSPMRSEPVDLVIWERAERVHGNDYNPNTVAPPEMKLLRHSVRANGYTMPIVGHRVADDEVIVVDGFHRRKVGTEPGEIRERCRGRLPVTQIRASRRSRKARIAATIEHNRARGEHAVGDMVEIVRMLYEAGWRDHKIQQELGMDADEVLRLKQMTGLAELFSEREFSRAWEPA